MKKLIKPVAISATNFWKVVVIHLDLFESTIIDERHFPNREDAETFEGKYANDDSVVCLSCLM